MVDEPVALGAPLSLWRDDGVGIGVPHGQVDGALAVVTVGEAVAERKSNKAIDLNRLLFILFSMNIQRKCMNAKMGKPRPHFRIRNIKSTFPAVATGLL